MRTTFSEGYAQMYADTEVMRFLEQDAPLDRTAAFRSVAESPSG